MTKPFTRPSPRTHTSHPCSATHVVIGVTRSDGSPVDLIDAVDAVWSDGADPDQFNVTLNPNTSENTGRKERLQDQPLDAPKENQNGKTV